MKKRYPGTARHACHPSTQQAEHGWVPGQSGLERKTFFSNFLSQSNAFKECVYSLISQFCNAYTLEINTYNSCQLKVLGFCFKENPELEEVAHLVNRSTQEAEARGSL